MKQMDVWNDVILRGKNANGCDIMCADVCFLIVNFSKKKNKLEFETASARNYVSNIKTG